MHAFLQGPLMVVSRGKHILPEQVREFLQIKRFWMIRMLMSTIICVQGKKASTKVHSKYDIVTGVIWKQIFKKIKVSKMHQRRKYLLYLFAFSISLFHYITLLHSSRECAHSKMVYFYNLYSTVVYHIMVYYGIPWFTGFNLPW